MSRSLVALIVTVFAGVASADQLQAGPVKVTLETGHTNSQDGAFVPLWVDLANESGAPREVTIAYQSYRAPRTTVKRTLTLEGRERTTTMLPFPASAGAGTFTVKSGLSSDETSLAVGAHPAALLVLGTPARLTEATGWDESSSASPVTFREANRFPTDVSMLAGWRAVLLVDDPAALSNPQRAALEAYVRTGGELRANTALGHVTLARWSGDLTEAAQTLGFGAVTRCAGTACLDVDQPTETAPSPVFDGPYGGSFENLEPSATLLPDVGRAPVAVFLLLIILFAVAIGPGNFALARRFGRHMMLVTTPLLAMTTCGGIATFGAFSDGLFTVHAASSGVTLLDSEAHEATTVGVTGFYASLAPDALKYPAQTALLLTKEHHGVTIDATNGFTLSSVVPSRTYVELATRTVTTTRARMRLDGETLENALGGNVRTAWVRRGDEILVFESVADGGRGAVSSRLPGNNVIAANDWESRLPGWVRRHAINTGLEDGEFLALVDGSLFVLEGGLAVERHGTLESVRGKVER